MRLSGCAGKTLGRRAAVRRWTKRRPRRTSGGVERSACVRRGHDRCCRAELGSASDDRADCSWGSWRRASRGRWVVVLASSFCRSISRDWAPSLLSPACQACTAGVLDTEVCATMEFTGCPTSPSLALVRTLVFDPAARAAAPRHAMSRADASLNEERPAGERAHGTSSTLGGDLAGFTSLGFDDHVKLFFPEGPAGAAGEPPMASRDYTSPPLDPAAKHAQDRGSRCRTPAPPLAGPGRCIRHSMRIGCSRCSFIIADQLRLASADRGRHRTARARAPAGGASGRYLRRRPARGGRSWR